MKHNKESYFLAMNGVPTETSQKHKNFAEWGIIVKKNRSIGKWLGNKGKIGADDRMLLWLRKFCKRNPISQMYIKRNSSDV